MRRRLSAAVALALALASLGCASSSQTERGPKARSKADTTMLRKQLAFSLAAHREWAAATRPLLELRAQYPDDADVHALLGTVYREQGLFEQAETSYKTAIRLAPKSAAAYVGLGILREVRGDAGDDAVGDFQTAIRLRPEEATFHNNLGFALYVRGRYAEAEAAFQKGLRQDPLSRRMRNNLGFVYGKMGQFSRAKREFQHGGREDEVENNLGFVHEQAKDVAAACVHYREALAKNPLLTVAADNAHRACGEGAAVAGPTPDVSDSSNAPGQRRSP